MTEMLVADLKIHGAILKDDAIEVFGKEKIDQAFEEKIIKSMLTTMGDILYLSFRGRKAAGFVGGYNPNAQALMNSAFIRKVEDIVVKRYNVPISRDRKHSISFTFNEKRVLVLARQNGYTTVAVRRIYLENIPTNIFHEIHIFYYDLSFKKIRQLRRIFFAPSENKSALDKNMLKIYSVDPENYSIRKFNGQKTTLPV